MEERECERSPVSHGLGVRRDDHRDGDVSAWWRDDVKRGTPGLPSLLPGAVARVTVEWVREC